MKASPRPALLISSFILLVLLVAGCASEDPHATVGGGSEIPTGIGGTGGATNQSSTQNIVMMGITQKQSSENFVGVTMVGQMMPNGGDPVQGKNEAFDESLLDFGLTLADQF